jgi:hypothetical protein
MPIEINSEQKAALVRFLSLPDKTLYELLEALKATAPTISPVLLARQISNAADVPVADIRAALLAFGWLILYGDQAEVQRTEVVKQVSDALRPEFNEPKEATERIEAWLDKFLSLEVPLGISYKAGNIIVQHQHPVARARILTDLRPVFPLGEIRTPEAALIVHNLEVETVSVAGPERTDVFFFALDSNDLRRLKKVIDRAIQKEDLLRSMIQKSGVRVLDVK